MSLWLKEKELIKLKEKKRKRLLLSAEILTLVIISIWLLFHTKKTNNSSFHMLTLITLVLITILVIFILFMEYKHSKNYKKLEQYLYTLLTSPEEVALFDSEMLSVPLSTIKISSSGGEISFTKHFFLYTHGMFPVKNYQIIKLKDIKIAKTRIFSTHSKRFDLRKKYATTLLNPNNQVLGCVDLLDQEEHNALINALCLYLPDLSLE